MSEYDPVTGATFAERSPQQDDKGVIPEFYMRAMPNAFKTSQENRPIFDEVEYCKISVIGSRLNEVDERVTDVHRRRFPSSYARFKAGHAQAESGTPLEEWPPMTVNLIAELKAINIRSVEQVAAVGDDNLKNLGTGGLQLRAKARAYVSGAKDGAELSEALGRAERSEEVIKQLHQQLAQMQQQLMQLQSKYDSLPPSQAPLYNQAGQDQ